MRRLATGMLLLAAAGCTARDAEPPKADATVSIAAVAFDGADYGNDSAKTAHGKRIATLFACNACHGTYRDVGRGRGANAAGGANAPTGPNSSRCMHR